MEVVVDDAGQIQSSLGHEKKGERLCVDLGFFSWKMQQIYYVESWSFVEYFSYLQTKN